MIVDHGVCAIQKLRQYSPESIVSWVHARPERYLRPTDSISQVDLNSDGPPRIPFPALVLVIPESTSILILRGKSVSLDSVQDHRANILRITKPRSSNLGVHPRS